MSLIDRIVGQSTTQNNKQPTQAPENELSLQELEYLLNVLKSAQLVGDQVEMFYIMVVKLQNQYVKQAAK
jgi:hypothetical protein